MRKKEILNLIIHAEKNDTDPTKQIFIKINTVYYSSTTYSCISFPILQSAVGGIQTKSGRKLYLYRKRCSSKSQTNESKFSYHKFSVGHPATARTVPDERTCLPPVSEETF